MALKKLPLRPNVCMLVFNRKGQLLMGERFGNRGHWQFPQGGAEPRYTPRQNVMRELREELGIQKKHVASLTKLKATHEYDWKSPPKYADGKWRGQKQTFWLVEFIGLDDDIDLTTHTEPEFRSWKWCSVSDVRRRAAPHRLAGYREPLREFLEFKKLRASKSSKSPAQKRRSAA